MGGLFASAISPERLIPSVSIPFAAMVIASVIYGRITAPGVAIGNFALQMLLGYDLATALLLSLSSALITLMTALICERFVSGRRIQDHPRSAIRSVAAAFGLIAPLNAVMGALILTGLDTNFQGFYDQGFRWWQADVLAYLCVAPTFAALIRRDYLATDGVTLVPFKLEKFLPHAALLLGLFFWSTNPNLFSTPIYILLATPFYVAIVIARSPALYNLNVTISVLWLYFLTDLGQGPFADLADPHLALFAVSMSFFGPGWFLVIALKRYDEQAAELMALAEQSLQQADSTKLMMFDTLNQLSLARDNETGNHILRTQHYVKEIARRLSQRPQAEARHLTDEAIETLFLAAPLHDIGKVGIPDSILLKPGKLDAKEWETMKTHALIGETVLTTVSNTDTSAELLIAKQIAGGHHEKWDGTGYPRGLAGSAIPLPARIMALADVYDALISIRVYKEAWSHEDALAEIQKLSGSQFDPEVVRAFLAAEESILAISEQFKDEEDRLDLVITTT